LTGKKCYAGLDLSSTGDLTAISLLFPPQDEQEDWRVIFEGWIPDEKIKERGIRDGVPFEQWVKNKYIHATPGNAVDYDFVEARIIALSKQYEITALCPDPWNSQMLTQRLSKEGINIVEIPQTLAMMSPAMKESERMLKTGVMTHEKNPVARWCFGNIHIATDGNENIKPMKNKSKDRIDLIVALINAMAMAVKNGDTVRTIYNERGLADL
jgi:phage terminase large subunit-like protein